MKFKVLLCCTKAKPYLYKSISLNGVYRTEKSKLVGKMRDTELNGKIVAECDFKVEEIFRDFIEGKDYTINPNGVWVRSYYFKTITLYESELYNKGCLTFEQMWNYFDDVDDMLVGRAIHIENLHIFEEPKELDEYYYAIPKKMNGFQGPCYVNTSIDKVPKNMIYAIDSEDNECIIIPVSPEEMCRIANHKQPVLVRKKVLKGMLKNE